MQEQHITTPQSNEDIEQLKQALADANAEIEALKQAKEKEELQREQAVQRIHRRADRGRSP